MGPAVVTLMSRGVDSVNPIRDEHMISGVIEVLADSAHDCRPQPEIAQIVEMRAEK